MANPNIVNVTSIYGKTAGQIVSTSPTAIITNLNQSGKILKINSLYISNINGLASNDITVDIYKNQTTAYRIAYTISVPNDSSIVIISKDAPLYLEENDSLRLTALTINYLEAVCSYEEIS